MAVSKNKNTSRGVYKIVDAKQILIGIGCFALCIYGGMAAPSQMEANLAVSPWTVSMFFFALAILAFIYLRANWKGIILDTVNDTMEFPGGGIEANDIMDYIKPKWLLQVFRRTKITISDIRSMDAEDKTKSEVNNSGKIVKKHSYSLHINGNFGAITLYFSNAGKRDELYSKIREINSMGTPIIKE